MTYKSRIYYKVVEELLEFIDTNNFQVGSYLPFVRELALKFGVSRDCIRRAQIVLESQGRLKNKPGSGVYIFNKKNIRSNKLPHTNYFEIIEAHSLFAAEITALAAPLITNEIISELEKLASIIIGEVKSEMTPDEAVAAFYTLIAKVTNNRAIIFAIETMWKMKPRDNQDHQIHQRIYSQVSTSLDNEYRAIIGALKKRDPAQSRKVTQKYFSRIMEALLKASELDAYHTHTHTHTVAMATSTKAGMVGYNVQTVVDTEHHLIVAHEVTNIVSDKLLLTQMTKQGQAAIGRADIKVFADRGYFSGAEIMATEKLGAITYVPKPYTSGSKAAGRFGKHDFLYQPEDNSYQCPGGQKMTYRFMSVEQGKDMQVYWPDGCDVCPVKAKCTTGKQRRIKRWVNEDIIDAMLKRLNELPEAMAIRRATVEHPFGTLKSWMGVTHFLTKRLKNVKTEMSLSVLAYNIRRMITMMGVTNLIRVIQA